MEFLRLACISVFIHVLLSALVRKHGRPPSACDVQLALAVSTNILEKTKQKKSSQIYPSTCSIFSLCIFFVRLVIAPESSGTTKSPAIGPQTLCQRNLQPCRSMCQQRSRLQAEGAIYFSRSWDQKFQLFCVETWRSATWRSLTGAERETLSGHRVVRAAFGSADQAGIPC